ncbi:MerR family transcriptional regulator [Enterococcus florum]|uniref:MerR family transcriptional regulator n=1 Tax=Enterococcus florum TaxID=2480627 RepID=A0A4V0WPZ8_9ENTE|nr:MerR family transcriptional regulator [Enterococcus florum]GCF95609.1 MerR family transcriptional regulator [Enterococcus florum]
MNIAAVSKKYGIPSDTLRYYERVGIIPPVTRDEKGYRTFTEYDQNWVFFAKVMRKAGVSVEALIEYGTLFRQGREESQEARTTLLVEQRELLTERIKEMQQTLEYLNYKIEGNPEHLKEFEKKLEQQQDRKEVR